jgi:ribonuclease BN (tRNA processing enzyme)
MKIKVIGCGNAFSKINFNQSFLLSENGRNMLIDFGARIPMALDYHGINVKDIHDVYISHQHADHIGGLEELAFLRYDWIKHPQHFSEGKYAPRLICNENLMRELWETSLKGGLKSMEGFDATMETFFETYPVPPNKPFEWQGWKVSLIQQIHVMTGSVIMNTFGLFFEKEGHKTVYFTTDSQHCSPKQVEVFYKKADLIFQDCEVTGADMTARVLDFKSGVHANYAELAGFESANATKLNLETKNKMWLSHYQDFVHDHVDYKGKPCDWEKTAAMDGFAGFLKVAQEFEV